MSKERDPKHASPPGDTRRHLRSPLIILKVRLEDGSKAFFGYAKNISRSGMFIATVKPRAPGERFPVEIPLPMPLNRRVVCNCEVVWGRLYERQARHEPGMGLKFIDLPADAAEAIDAWVRSQLADRGEPS